MKAIKLFAALAVISLSAVLSTPASAQEKGRGPYLTNRFIDNTFVGVSGGISAPFHKDHKPAISPMFDVHVGKWITPNIGLKIGYTGMTGAIWSPTQSVLTGEVNPSKNMFRSRYNYAYVHADVLWNLSNTLGGYKPERIWNFIPYLNAGWFLGYNRAGQPDFRDNELALGAGLLNNIRVHERVNLILDLRALFVNGRFHATTGDCTTTLSASFGISVNLFKTGWTRSENWRNPKDVDRVAAAEASADALSSAKRALESQNAKLAKNNEELAAEVEELKKRPTETKAALCDVGPAYLYFEIGQTTLSEKELQHLDFYFKNVLPNVGDKKATILTGSADSKTGTVKRNQYLCQKRVDYVLNLLNEKYGLESDRFQVKTQIAKEGKPALNRAVIISFE